MLAAVAQQGAERGEMSSPLRFWGTFSIRTAMYYNLSLSIFNGNEQFTCFGGSMPVLQGNFMPHGAQPGLNRAHPRLWRGPSNIKRAKTTSFDSFWRGPLDQGAIPWLILPPSQELWLRRPFSSVLVFLSYVIHLPLYSDEDLLVEISIRHISKLHTLSISRECHKALSK